MKLLLKAFTWPAIFAYIIVNILAVVFSLIFWVYKEGAVPWLVFVLFFSVANILGTSSIGLTFLQYYLRIRDAARAHGISFDQMAEKLI